MKKASSKKPEPAMRENYDFASGVRGKYARRYSQGTNVVLLEPDVARAFPNAAAVNDSLRKLAGIIRRGKETLEQRFQEPGENWIKAKQKKLTQNKPEPET